MAIISINYAEGASRKSLGYKSVQIEYGKRVPKKKIFGSGDFVVDWFECNCFFVEELNTKREPYMLSSSVDHFFDDGASKLYDIAILHFDKENSKLEYGKRSGGDLTFYVKKRTRPTWRKFRELVGYPMKTAKAKSPNPKKGSPKKASPKKR